MRLAVGDGSGRRRCPRLIARAGYAAICLPSAAGSPEQRTAPLQPPVLVLVQPTLPTGRYVISKYQFGDGAMMLAAGPLSIVNLFICQRDSAIDLPNTVDPFRI